MIVCEDNEAVIKVCAKGRSNALRHLPRVHTIALNWLFGVVGGNNCKIVGVHTEYQIADIFTKAVTKSEVWIQLLYLAQIHPYQASTDSSPLRNQKLRRLWTQFPRFNQESRRFRSFRCRRESPLNSKLNKQDWQQWQ